MIRWPVAIVTVVWLSVFTYISLEATGDIVLTVEGPGGEYPILMTERRIRILPKTSFFTFDPWDGKRHSYSGVRLLTLLDDIGLLNNTTIIQVISRNNYRANMEVADVHSYNHLLSYEMDGSDYSILEDQDKGPLAIAVDVDDLGEIERQRLKNQVVWWIERIVLQ